jgi:hypothetical protein
MSAEEVGPPWLRTDPNVRASQDAVGSGVSSPDLTPGSQTQEGPMPWQTPGEGAGSQVSPEEAPSDGHFPIVIFVILVLGIIIAVGAFLFAQGSLPFGG